MSNSGSSGFTAAAHLLPVRVAFLEHHHLHFGFAREQLFQLLHRRHRVFRGPRSLARILLLLR
jgi:hypothetical protein